MLSSCICAQVERWAKQYHASLSEQQLQGNMHRQVGHCVLHTAQRGLVSLWLSPHSISGQLLHAVDAVDAEFTQLQCP